MKRTLMVLSFLSIFMMIGYQQSQAQGYVGMTFDNNGVQSFDLAIGNYYGVPSQNVYAIQREGIPENEVPVVLYFAQHSRYSPDVIIRMRREGRSWLEISDQCGIGRDAYYGMIEQRSGPPYGNAYGYWKHRGGRYLSDADVINAVNVRFFTDGYHCNAADVYRLRSDGRSFSSIYNDLCYRNNRYNNDRYNDNRYGHDQGWHGKGHGKHKGWSRDDH